MSTDIYKSYVYLFVKKDEFAFKIGKSDDPNRRFNNLKNQYQLKNQFNIIECENSIKAFELEQLLHKTFSKFRLDVDNSTEFFEYDIYSSVCNLISEFTNHKLELVNVDKPTHQLYNLGFNKNNLVNFCTLIKTKRKEMGYTQSQFASKIGCARSTLQKIESDSSYNESFQLYITIADLLKIQLSFN